MAIAVKLVYLGLIACSLSACGWAGPMGEENPYLLPEKPGSETFTLVGDLPKDFGLSITGWYTPVDETAQDCKALNIYKREMQPRYLGKRFDIPINSKATVTPRKIPVDYYVGACNLRLGKVKLEIDGRHGDQSWQQTYADANFYIHKKSPDNQLIFDESGSQKINSECTWLFQQSRARSRLGEIEKLLVCKGGGANLQYDQLAGKKVTLAISVNPKERPTMRNRWIKSDEGWRPCLGTEKSDRCQNPPVFKTFKMNGKTCTVYPGCVESPSGYAE